VDSILHISDFEDEGDYNPFEVDAVNFGDMLDPYPQIHKWREKGPVIRGGYRQMLGYEYPMLPETETFTVVGSAEIAEALAHPDIFSNKGFEPTVGATFGKTLTAMDNPEHRLYRQPFQKIFLPHHVKKWGETIVDPIVHRLMEKFIHRGEADLLAEFTILYPFEVIYKQLNLPKEDIASFQRIAVAQTDWAHAEIAIEAGRRLGLYFKDLLDKRRADPGDDLITQLADTRLENGEPVPEEVLLSFLRQLMNAAGDTTYRGTSVLMVALLSNPEQLEAIRLDRSLINQAIEEALRWDGPVTAHLRMATRDTELGGVKIPKGAFLDLVAGAANRDPEVFENPDQFDIFRKRIPNFAFARGPHICVGQHLARVEMTRALHAILDNMHNLLLDPDKPKPEIRGAIMRVPHYIHVKFDPK